MAVEENLRKKLIETSEMLHILEQYLSMENGKGLEHPISGARAMLRESRSRIESVVQQLSSSHPEVPSARQNAAPQNSAARTSLASRIQRMPEGEFRTLELDLEAELAELGMEE